MKINYNNRIHSDSKKHRSLFLVALLFAAGDARRYCVYTKEFNKEKKMSTYVPALIWAISAGICYYIAKRKNIRPTVLWNITVVFLGPIAIPLLLITKGNKMSQHRESTHNL